MEQERKAMRVGLMLISFAVVWKLLSGGALAPVASFFRLPQVVSFLLYLETGRVVQAQAAEQTEAPTVVPTTEPTAEQTEAPTQPPTEQTEAPAEPAQFGAEESSCISLFNTSGCSVDLEALLTSPLQWQLTAEAPTVLILHTHATESYTRGGLVYEESSPYRTLDNRYNMIRVGAQVKEVLESYGISVIHDTTLHDHPTYSGSYQKARETAQKWLAEQPSIQVVLDIHRDSVELSDGAQMETAAFSGGRAAAQLMLVMGSEAGGLEHPRWQENLALALKLHVALERSSPGIMRPLYLRSERFNQDLLPGWLLVEVGAAGDTLEEALTAAEALGHALGALRQGAN